MAKLTIHDADAPIAAHTSATTEITVTDALGRRIKVRKLRPSERGRLSRKLGQEAAGDPVTFGHSFIAASVTEMDGDPVFFPQSLIEAEALADRLGDEGLEAAGGAIAEHFASRAATPAEIHDAKN
jgi:hypothetical protein